MDRGNRRENERERGRENICTSCCGDRRGTEIGESEAFRLWLPNPLSPLALGLCEADRAFSGIGNEVSERAKRQF